MVKGRGLSGPKARFVGAFGGLEDCCRGGGVAGLEVSCRGGGDSRQGLDVCWGGGGVGGLLFDPSFFVWGPRNHKMKQGSKNRRGPVFLVLGCIGGNTEGNLA